MFLSCMKSFRCNGPGSVLELLQPKQGERYLAEEKSLIDKKVREELAKALQEPPNGEAEQSYSVRDHGITFIANQRKKLY